MEKLTTWKEALKVLKDNCPKGLFESWKEVEPYGVIDWGCGMDILNNVDNSYNWIDKDNNNIVYQSGTFNKEIDEDGLIAVAFHISGDVRGGYTDYFIFKYEDVMDLLYGHEDEIWKEWGGTIEE